MKEFKCVSCKWYQDGSCDPGVEKETLADVDNCQEYTKENEE